MDASFDAIYSMGTIEHFAETESALFEMARVLKPGGRAIIGVPNATIHSAAGARGAPTGNGLYGYGLEKSYSRRALREMIERAGLTVVAETAILFIPGWLRMVGSRLPCVVPPAAVLTGACAAVRVARSRMCRARARHGYLLATVATAAEQKT